MPQTWKIGNAPAVRPLASRAPSLRPSGAHARQSPRPMESYRSHLSSITVHYRSITGPLPSHYRLLPLITAYYRLLPPSVKKKKVFYNPFRRTRPGAAAKSRGRPIKSATNSTAASKMAKKAENLI